MNQNDRINILSSIKEMLKDNNAFAVANDHKSEIKLRCTNSNTWIDGKSSFIFLRFDDRKLVISLISNNHNLAILLNEENSVVEEVLISSQNEDNIDKDNLVTEISSWINTKNSELNNINNIQNTINEFIESIRDSEFCKIPKDKNFFAPKTVRENECLPLLLKKETKDFKYADYFNSEQLHFAVEFRGGKKFLKLNSTGTRKLETFTGIYNSVEIGDSLEAAIKDLIENISKSDFEKKYREANHEGLLDKISTLLTNNKNVILHGAPGTGKTWMALNEIKGIEKENLRFIQFHPSYDYTDFIEGIKPTASGGFERTDGVLKKFCKEAWNNLDKKYLLVIDEINRGEISKIFGETFSLIEASYRRTGENDGDSNKFKQTQYQDLVDENDIFQTGFFIPANVYIVGCMNDIDRSVEAFDFAMRRRFAWVEVTAADSQIMLYKEDFKYKDEALRYMNNLNNQITSKDSPLNEKYEIGAAYFLKLEKYNGDVCKLWTNHISNVIKDYLVGIDDATGNYYSSFFTAYFKDYLNKIQDNKTKTYNFSEFADKLNKQFKKLKDQETYTKNQNIDVAEWKNQTDFINETIKQIDGCLKFAGINGDSTFQRQGNLLDIPRHLFSHSAHPVASNGEYIIFQWSWNDTKTQLDKLNMCFAFSEGGWGRPVSDSEKENKNKLINAFFLQHENQKVREKSIELGFTWNEGPEALVCECEWSLNNDNNNTEKLKTIIEIYERWYIYASTNIHDANDLLESNYNLILHGAPGTGKTYMAGHELAKGTVKSVQFHPSFDYTDFVEGLRPNNNSFKLKSGIFKKFCEDAVEKETEFNNALVKYEEAKKNYAKEKEEFLKENSANLSEDTIYKIYDDKLNEVKQDEVKDLDSSQQLWEKLEDVQKTLEALNKTKFTFIIDEINRGEINKIFGELFFSIDPGYRGPEHRIYTQYQEMYDNVSEKESFKSGNGGFYIPKNVFIIACMNEIDRSVEPMDFAIRRRFAWANVKAIDTQFDILNKAIKEKGIFNKAVKKMNAINNLITSPEINLGEEYQIGASYFTKIADYISGKDADWLQLWDFHLKPILEDYLNGRSDDSLKKFFDTYIKA